MRIVPIFRAAGRCVDIGYHGEVGKRPEFRLPAPIPYTGSPPRQPIRLYWWAPDLSLTCRPSMLPTTIRRKLAKFPRFAVALSCGLLWACLPDDSAGVGFPTDRQFSRRYPDEAADSARPRPTHRQGGWEVRTRHFMIFCTTGEEDAAWTAEQMERAFSETVRLADQWIGTHQRKELDDAAVGVLVTDRPLPWRVPPTPGPSQIDYGPQIYVALEKGKPALRRQLPQMRRELFQTLLRLTRQDRLLPSWVQVGLAAYISDDELPQFPRGLSQFSRGLSQFSRSENGTVPFREPLARSIQTPARPITPDRKAAKKQDPREAILWVRYLLEGHDAAYAPDFFAAMAAAVAKRPADPFSPFDWNESVMRLGAAVSASPRTPLGELAASAAVRRKFSQWLADPAVGQPIIKPIPGDLPIDERHREMVLILKLARRFAPPTATPIRPRVYEFTAGRSRLVVPKTPEPGESGGDATAPAFSLAGLHRRLIDADTPRWATIDTDDTLLLSTDKDRLAAIFANPRRQYRTYRSEGHEVLESVLPSGETYQAWLEENPDKPQRPMVRIRRRPTG